MRLTLLQAAERVRLDANELRHLAQRGEVNAVDCGGEWRFDERDLDEWAQREILTVREKELRRRHRELAKGDFGAVGYVHKAAISLALGAKAKAGLVRDMSDLASRSGLVNDPDTLYSELMAREEIASTAVGCGMAFLHPRFYDQYAFEETFLAYGRTLRPVFFGAPDGGATQHFFLICANDRALHLKLLAHLAVLAHGTKLVERLASAATVAEVIDIIGEEERGLSR